MIDVRSQSRVLVTGLITSAANSHYISGVDVFTMKKCTYKHYIDKLRVRRGEWAFGVPPCEFDTLLHNRLAAQAARKARRKNRAK